ncbi:MAG: hypothetical protein ACREDR_24820 [Blastocatellia bacterium]
MGGDTLNLDLGAAILPDAGLGGLQLRCHIIDAQGLFSDRWGKNARLSSFSLLSPFEAEYRFLAGAISAYIDVRTGKIFMLSAAGGYRGNLLGKIYVGQSMGEANSAEPRLYYDESEAAVFCREVEGLSINLSEADPSPARVPELRIATINVYARETRSLRAQGGRW